MKTLSIALLILIAMSGHLNADNPSAADNKITLNLDDTSEVLVKGSIALAEESLSDTFKQWDALVNLRVAEPEKQHPTSVFQAFLPKKPVSVGELWVPDMMGCSPLAQATASESEFLSSYQFRGFVRFVGMPAGLQRPIRRHRVPDSCRI